MESQDMAEVVPLFGKRKKPSNVEVSVGWAEDAEPDPVAYRRLLELLFAPRERPQQDKAA